MTQELTQLDAYEARVLTDEVKADAAALWAKLLHLYKRGAHTALGKSSWAEYCADEFGYGHRRSYQLLDSARVIDALEPVHHGALPESERVARELVPVMRADPERVPEVWVETVRTHGPEPTAAQVREVIDLHDTDLGRVADSDAAVRRHRAMHDFMAAVSKTAALLPQLDNVISGVLEVDAEQARIEAERALLTWQRVSAALAQNSRMRRVK